jgi:hypothetical protein
VEVPLLSWAKSSIGSRMSVGDLACSVKKNGYINENIKIKKHINLYLF